jgi:hypothetical protein
MVKLLLLQQLYNLSDDVMEYQVLDRTSFQRFLGLEHIGHGADPYQAMFLGYGNSD